MIIFARFRTYCHVTEEEGRVREALSFISGVPSKFITVTVNKGYHGNEIRVLETEVQKGPALNKFLMALTDAGIFEKVKDEIKSRIDDEGMFFLRFDKQEAFKGLYVLDSKEDTIQVSIRVQAYPANPETILAALRAHIDKLTKKPKKKSDKDSPIA